MFWQDDTPKQAFRVPDDVVDLLFRIECRELPVDHAHALARALLAALPWLAEEPRIRVHNIHLAGSQNGWERPDPALGQNLILSRRTRLQIRLPKERIARILDELPGRTLEVEGHPLTLGEAKPHPLSAQGTIFSRQIALEPGEQDDEEGFLGRIAETLGGRGIRIRKALCGRTGEIHTPEGGLPVRSLLLADLSPEESVRLQQEGLGPHGLLGCGIFLPHKGIEAVREARQES